MVHVAIHEKPHGHKHHAAHEVPRQQLPHGHGDPDERTAHHGNQRGDHHHQAAEHRAPDPEHRQSQAAQQALHEGDREARGHAGRDQGAREGEQSLVALPAEGQDANQLAREDLAIPQQEEQQQKRDDQAQHNAGRIPRNPARALGRETGHTPRLVRQYLDRVFLRRKAGHSISGPGPARMQALRGRPRAILQDAIDLGHRVRTLIEQSQAGRDRWGHQQYESEQDEDGRGARGTQSRSQAVVGRRQTDGKHHRPSDLHQEGLDHPIGQIAQHQQRRVQDEAADLMILDVVGHSARLLCWWRGMK